MPTRIEDEEELANEAEGAEGNANGGVSRRTFLGGLGAAGVAVATPPALARAAVRVEEEPVVAGTVPLMLKVNGESHQLQIDPRTSLLDCLRENLEMSGTKGAATTGSAGRARCM